MNRLQEIIVGTTERSKEIRKLESQDLIRKIMLIMDLFAQIQHSSD